jgi:protein arginine kinase activator
MHKGERHVGKRPGGREEPLGLEQVKSMRSELAEAVRIENFEEAARIRDRLRKLEERIRKLEARAGIPPKT